MRQGEAMVLLSPPRVSILGELASCVDVARGYRSSMVDQRICLYKSSPVIEIQNKIR